jgi:hypothetical protein
LKLFFRCTSVAPADFFATKLTNKKKFAQTYINQTHIPQTDTNIRGMEKRELRGLLGTDLRAKLLPAVGPLGELHPSALDRQALQPPHQEFERIDCRHPSGILALFASLDADLRARIKAIAENEPMPVMDVNKVQAIGEQLCRFGTQCDIRLLDPENPDPNVICLMQREELFAEISMSQESRYDIVEELVALKKQYCRDDTYNSNNSNNDMQYLARNLQLLITQVEKAFKSVRSLLESIHILCSAHLAVIEIVRKSYLCDLATLAREVLVTDKEDDLALCQQFGNNLITWADQTWSDLDTILLKILQSIQDFCGPIVNVFVYQLTVLREERKRLDPSNMKAAETSLAKQELLVKKIEQWEKFLEQTLNLAQYVRVKPCNAPDSPSFIALQHAMVVLDRTSGPSPARLAAFTTAKLLLSKTSVVEPVRSLLEQVHQANTEHKEDIAACSQQFQNLYIHFRDDTKKQHALVASLQRKYQLAEQDSMAARASDIEITPVHQARHLVVLQRMAEIKPQLEKETMHLTQLNEEFRKVSSLAASRSKKCPVFQFDHLKKQEDEAASRLSKIASEAAKLFERQKARACNGQTIQVEKKETECLNQFANACAQRNAALSNKLLEMPTKLKRETEAIKRSLDIILHWCLVQGGSVVAVRPGLLALEINAKLQRFMETRANLIVALHLFMRLKLFCDWKAT